MDNKHLGGNQIRRMTKDRLWYEEDGLEQFIDFEDCYNNYVQKSLSPETWENIKRVNQKTEDYWAEYEQRIRQYKYIADRQILTPPWDDGPYIEFYTNPPIRFKFAKENEVQKIRIFLQRSGWQTFDKS